VSHHFSSATVHQSKGNPPHICTVMNSHKSITILSVLVAILVTHTARDLFFNDAQRSTSPVVVHKTPTGQYDVTLHYYRAVAVPTPDMPNITLVAHATIDRLHAVARWCRTLRGPLSISVFVRPFVDDVAAVMGAFAADECIARHADLHLVTERGHRYEPREDGGKDMMTHYPFNVQRNAALDGCVGDLALLMDIDFHLMPVPNNREVDLRRNLDEQRQKMAAWPFLSNEEPWVLDAAVYVIPAVETMNKRVKLPRTMTELRAGLDDHSVLAFYHTCQTCHRPTDLRRFSRQTTTEAYLVQFEEGYEPYVIINRSSTTPHSKGARVPRYDETFVGRGWDKMSFFYELALGQQRPFVVLPRYFLVHHGKGDMPKFLTMEYIKRQEVNRALMGIFKERMSEMYGIGANPALAVPLQTRDPSMHHGATDALKSELKRSDCDGSPLGSDCSSAAASRMLPTQHPVVLIVDELLWRSTEGIEWAALSTTLGFPVSCLVSPRAIRALIDVSNGSAEAAIESLEGIVDTACQQQQTMPARAAQSDDFPLGHEPVAVLPAGRLDCKQLWRVRGGTPLQSAMRRADWVVERLFHVSLSDGRFADPGMACAHVGKSLTMLVDHRREGDDVETNQLDQQQLNDATATGAEEEEGIMGCTLHRDSVTLTMDAVHQLLDLICSDGNDDDDNDKQDVLGRGGCAELFSQVHEVVREDARIQLAVALNAHHFIYRSVPGHTTCSRRWGDAAAFTRMPTLQQWR
jgi:hypothetical protein